RLVLTVSPVPLRASVHPLGAVVADEESKSTLRVAARIFCARHLEVVYFPSFEIVRKLEHRPYLDDNRHVKPEVVARIMRTFMMHFGDLPPTAVEAQARDDARFLARSRRSLEFSFRARYVRERILRALEGAEHAGRRVALMGGGRHSAFVIERCGLGPAALARLVVLDDAPATAFIGPVPVLRPAEARPGDFDSVIASSDSMEAALLARARQWAGSVGESGGPEVIALYEGLPEGPYAAADAA
ncbi:MAG: GSCFA domain-containing protein, partial [Planctomycetota bacterium]|nr:GSCFA domain-containing protein [Planctomycetota bacterium]